MTNALEDLTTSTSLFSTILQNEGVDLEELDYVEFLEDTLPALGERIEKEVIDIIYKQFVSMGNEEFGAWLEYDLDASVE